MQTMKILFIASGFPPYMFSENIVNGKLVLAFQKEGWEVDVISKKDEGNIYSENWVEPFVSLKKNTHEVTYSKGKKLVRIFDLINSTIALNGYPIAGVRWAKRAYNDALLLINSYNYDCIMTRSPSDISHLVGYNLSKKTAIPWIANWNDPAETIWPEPYKTEYSFAYKLVLNRFISKVLKQADYSTFPSEKLRVHFIKNFEVLQKKRTKVIPHIALVDHCFKKGIKNSRANGTIYLCHAGNLSDERDSESLFRAIREAKENYSINLRLDIMGAINSFAKNQIRKYELQKEVNFIGSFQYIDALNQMAQYDVLVLIEAKMDFGIYFPSKLVDYCQVQVPILSVSPKQGFCRELFSRFRVGVCVDNENSEEILYAIQKFSDLKRANQLKKSFEFDSLQTYFSCKNVIEQYRWIFNDLL